MNENKTPYVCELCGYVYIPQEEGQAFKNLSDQWNCPDCGALKGDFFVPPWFYTRKATPLPDALETPTFQEPERAVSALWTDFKEANTKGEEPELPDFSYAGYAYGTEARPEATGSLFNVSDYGARPNQEGSDRHAVEKAISAAEEAGGGIIYFPPGLYNLSEEEGCYEPIRIRKGNIVLKGAGRDKTELFMKHHLNPKDTRFLWTTPRMFLFQSEETEEEELAQVIKESRRETFTLTVDNTSRLKEGELINIYVRSTQASEDFLDGRKPWDIWTATREKGPLIMEKHRIRLIEGNIITLAEPLHTNLKPEWGVSLRSYQSVPGWIVEDLTFRGNWKEEVIHHKNYIHDSGWSFLAMVRGEEPIVRRVEMIDINEGIVLCNCFLGTLEQIRVSGNRGHCFIHASGGCYGTLIFRCTDSTGEGMWHGPGANKAAAGTVILEYEGKEKSGPDFHASWPYCTLIDDSHSGLVGNGGNYSLLPNHGKYLVWWNHKHIGNPVRNYNFWETPIADECYSGVKAVSPYLVGYHDAYDTSFDERSTAQVESFGRPVEPRSLYKAQLQLRLGTLPDWF